MMCMACVMCQIAPIKADLYFSLFIPHGEGEKRTPSESKKKKCKENEEKEEQDRRKPFRKLDQLTAFMPNLLINILLVNYGLHLLEIWDLHQANYIGNYLLKYPEAVTHEEKCRLCTKNKLIRRKCAQQY